jgi:hypothetical protein
VVAEQAAVLVGRVVVTTATLEMSTTTAIVGRGWPKFSCANRGCILPRPRLGFPDFRLYQSGVESRLQAMADPDADSQPDVLVKWAYVASWRLAVTRVLTNFCDGVAAKKCSKRVAAA